MRGDHLAARLGPLKSSADWLRAAPGDTRSLLSPLPSAAALGQLHRGGGGGHRPGRLNGRPAGERGGARTTVVLPAASAPDRQIGAMLLDNGQSLIQSWAPNGPKCGHQQRQITSRTWLTGDRAGAVGRHGAKGIRHGQMREPNTLRDDGVIVFRKAGAAKFG